MSLRLKAHVRSIEMAADGSPKPSFLILNCYILDDALYFDKIWIEIATEARAYAALFCHNGKEETLELHMPALRAGLYEGKPLRINNG